MKEMKEMLSKKEVREILLSALSRGGDFAEIFMEDTEIVEVLFDDGKVEKIITGTEQGTGIRAVDNGKTYFANSNTMDFQELVVMAENLSVSIGKNSVITDIEFQHRNLPVYSEVKIDPRKVSIDKKIELLKIADKAARKCDDRVIQASCKYIERIQNVLIANSEGIFDTDQRFYPALRVVVSAKDKNLIQTGHKVMSGTQGFEIFGKEKIINAGKEAAKTAIFQLGAEPAIAGTYPVVLKAESGAGVFIHEALGHAVEYDHIKNHASFLIGKFGEQVASPLVTVIDNPTIPNSRGQYRFDDEGYPAQENVLIKDGILVGYYHDRKSANEMSVKQTGSGRRESFRYLPIPRMGITYMDRGETNPQDIVNSLKYGVIVEKMSGSGMVDTLTGKFMFGISRAWFVENGKRTPIRGASLTGKALDVLMNIEMVGSDLMFGNGGTCGKDGQEAPVNDGLPTIKISEMTIGGIVKDDKEEEN